MDRRVLDVALFEFRRFLDLKGELISVAILVLIALIRFGGDAMVMLAIPVDQTILVESDAPETFPRSGVGRFNFIAVESSARLLSLQRIEEGAVDGLLVAEAPGNYRLYTKAHVYWQGALAESFGTLHRSFVAKHLEISPADLQAIREAPEIMSTPLDGNARGAEAGVYAAAICVMVLSILGITSSQSIIVQGIAGEKFGKISEIILSTISPSVWIDGKLFAASLHGVKTMLVYSVYGCAASLLLGILTAAQLLDVLHAWPQLVVALLAALSGVAFWNVGFAWVAAMLPSATSPVRNTLILVPMTCLLLCLGGAREPDNVVMIALSYLPPTMPFAMPVRIVTGTAGEWEAILSAVLCVGVTVALRHHVMKVFSEAVLGECPSHRSIELR